MMNKKFLIISILVFGISLGGILGSIVGILVDRQLRAPAEKKQTAVEHAQKHLLKNYICPMHSEVLSADEGSCPICGMDLVKIKPANEGEDASIVRVPPMTINNMGVRVVLVQRKSLARKIETPGFIQQTRKESFSVLKAPAKGRVKKFYFRKGQWLEKGDALIDLELDDLELVQNKHLELLQKNTSDKNTAEKLTTEQTRNLMLRAGMSEAQITHLENTQKTSPLITLYAKHAGEVKELRVSEGEAVKSNQMLLSLGGLLRVSVVANAFQRDANWIRPGNKVDIIMPHNAAKVWPGVVSSGATSINTNSQNIGVKLTFNAPDTEVKNGMYVVGHIYGKERKNVLAIPRDAVIYSQNNNRVIVALGEGRFKPVPVKTGIVSGDEVEIISGLQEGDTVVVSAQFLIDSESSLQASYRRMSGVE